jgi:hypothetical protein
LLNLHRTPPLSLPIQIQVLLVLAVAIAESWTVLYTVSVPIVSGTKLQLHSFPLPLPLSHPSNKIPPSFRFLQSISKPVRIADTTPTRPSSVLRLKGLAKPKSVPFTEALAVSINQPTSKAELFSLVIAVCHTASTRSCGT